MLFTIAGMAPFKPYFLGQTTPPFPRATSVQKCVRTGDIENVGITTRHNTFFQMAGNFSFGDYFKEGAIRHAWTLLTGSLEDGGYGLDPERLWVTVYETDDEAHRLWQERRRGAGRADPAPRDGRQLLVDGRARPVRPVLGDLLRPRTGVRHRGRTGRRRGPLPRGLEPGLHAGHARRRQGAAGGNSKADFPILGPLPQQNIDTGLGVERLAFLLQGVENVYETDLLRPIIARMESLSGADLRRRTRPPTSGCG